ncbi:MAG: epoxyqueuosine reductase [Clostridia bacterium]|nr:epoxyqueuosine reductase [Clostridia bacterium]
MLDLCKCAFRNENIEYIGILPIESCKIINQSLYDRTCAWAKSVILFLVPYYTEDKPERNISLYAVPRDYHSYMASLSDRIVQRLQYMQPDRRFRGMADHSPIAETSAAAMAGLGIIGDNYRLINEKYGSYVFIGEIFTDMVCTEVPKEISFCYHCGACRNACPSPDSCLSALTQQKGELEENTAALMKNYHTAWGCDICQTVCPYNNDIEKTPIDFFWQDRIFELTPEILDGMSDEELKTRAFGWRKRKTIERNIKLLTE